MKICLHHAPDAPWQQLRREWHGAAVEPPVEFRFRLTAEALVFSARRAAPALLHPEAREGAFQENLWKYDTAEFYIAPVQGQSYLEFNLAPNGAWWAASFTAPRVRSVTPPTLPQGVITHGHADARGWECEALLPLEHLRQLGITPGPASCRLAAAAILGSPEQIFLTTAIPRTGKPDFHHPEDWEEAG